MIRTLCLLILLASPAAAQTRDQAFATLWQDLYGTINGNVYSQPISVSNTQDWSCQTCMAGQSIRIQWYDWAYNYDTTDPSVVLARITGACQFDPCTNTPFQLNGLSGVLQSGTHRTGDAARSFLIVGDRMYSIYVRGMPSVQAALDRASAAEAAIYPLLLAANP